MADRPVFRTLAAQRPDPPAPTHESDVLDRTARQVRVPGGFTHRLAVATTGRLGRAYTSDCDRTYYGADGVVLTTNPVTCPHCGGGS